MSKVETDKELLALRYPIDVDVTDDVSKKRYVFFLKTLSEYEVVTFEFSLDYIPSGFGSSTSNGMKRLEQDVKDADRLYKASEEEEDVAIERLRRYQGINAGILPSTPDDAELLQNTEDALQKVADKAGKKRRKLHTQLEKRIKTRDTASELKNEMVDRKEGQIYFDGTLYTARWACLPM